MPPWFPGDSPRISPGFIKDFEGIVQGFMASPPKSPYNPPIIPLKSNVIPQNHPIIPQNPPIIPLKYPYNSPKSPLKPIFFLIVSIAKKNHVYGNATKIQLFSNCQKNHFNGNLLLQWPLGGNAAHFFDLVTVAVQLKLDDLLFHSQFHHYFNFPMFCLWADFMVAPLLKYFFLFVSCP